MSFKTGEFTPWKSEQNGNKQRMAGDYLSDFVNANANDKKDEQKDFTYQGSNGKDYGTNTEKMLFGNSPTSSQPSASGNVKQPAVTEDAKSVKTPNTSGGFKLADHQQKMYDQNLQTIANYNGKNGANSTANGAAYNADLMSGVNYDRAVRQNEKFDAIIASQNSIASGADHGTTEHKAPKSKDYYSYLDTYDGPKSYDQVVQVHKSMDPAEIDKLGKEKARPYDKWEQWKKDKMDYEAAWGSGQSVAQQKGWS